MTLIVKEKEMNKRDFETIRVLILDEVRHIAFNGFSAWYARGTGNFKINQDHRRILEKHLYVID